jgi:hypothetical protein
MFKAFSPVADQAGTGDFGLGWIDEIISTFPQIWQKTDLFVGIRSQNQDCIQWIFC